MIVTRVLLTAALASALALAGCGKNSNVSTQSAGASSAAEGGGPTVVTAGTVFDGKLQQEIGSKTSKDGDTFTLTQTDTLMHRNAALHGAVLEGHLAGVSPAGLGKKPAMTIVFDDVKMPDGTTAPVNVQLVSLGAFDAKSHKLRTLGMMIGGGAAGHAAASAAGKSHGGLIGAAGGYMLSQQMKSDIDVKPGTTLEVKFLTNANANGASPGTSDMSPSPAST